MWIREEKITIWSTHNIVDRPELCAGGGRTFVSRCPWRSSDISLILLQLPNVQRGTRRYEVGLLPLLFLSLFIFWHFVCIFVYLYLLMLVLYHFLKMVLQRSISALVCFPFKVLKLYQKNTCLWLHLFIKRTATSRSTQQNLFSTMISVILV